MNLEKEATDSREEQELDAEPDTPQEDAGGEDASRQSDAPSEPDTGRGSRREEELAERLRSVEAQARFYQEENERTRRDLETSRSAQRPDPREEQARIEAMDPEQRVLY